MDRGTGKTVLDDFRYKDLIKELDAAKRIVTDSNDGEIDVSSVQKLLRNCVEMLSNGERNLQCYTKTDSRASSNTILTKLVSYEIGIIAAFKHCSESIALYGKSMAELKDLMAEMFKTLSAMQTSYFNIVVNTDFDFTVDGHLDSLLDALKHIWHATKAVHNASAQTMALFLSRYATLTHKYCLQLKDNVIIDEPIDFLCAEIQNKVSFFDEKTSLKWLKFMMNILVKLYSIGRMLDTRSSLVEVLLFLNSYWLPENRAVIKKELLPFVDKLVSISDEKFVEAFKSICNDIVRSDSSSQKVSALYIAMLLLKSFVKTPCEPQAFDIICMIFQLIKCTDFAVCYSSVHNNVYEPMLINMASVILVSDPSLFEKVEKILIKNVLNVEYWPAIFSCDLWIVITRYLPPRACDAQFLKLALLYETLAGFPCFTRCPQHVYLKMLLNRHFALVKNKTHIVNTCPQFKMSNFKSAVGLLRVPTLSKYDRLSELTKIIEILPRQKNIDHLNEDILHLWSCVKDEHPPHFMCTLIDVSISSKQLLQKVIQKVCKILNTRINNETTEMKRFKLKLVRAIILLEPCPENLIMDVFFKYLCDPHPLVKQWAVETVVYFASVTKNKNMLISMFVKRPQIRTIVTDYLEMKINRVYNHEEYVLFFEQLSKNGRFQHKCSFNGKLDKVLDRLRSDVDCLNNLVCKTQMSTAELRKLNECSSLLSNVCTAAQTQIQNIK